MRLSYLKFIKVYFLLISLTFPTEIDSSFSLKWQNEPWGAGGLIPAGPAWNMVGPYDFDNDGYGDFVVSSSYSGEYCNGVYHYEAIENDSITFRIPDGTKKNSYIGNLPQNANFASNSDSRKFKLVTGDGNLITVSFFYLRRTNTFLKTALSFVDNNQAIEIEIHQLN